MKFYKIFIVLVLACSPSMSSAMERDNNAFDSDYKMVAGAPVLFGTLGVASCVQAYALRNHLGHNCVSEVIFVACGTAASVLGILGGVFGMVFASHAFNPSTNLSRDRRCKAFGLASIGLLPIGIGVWALNKYQCDNAN